jgi:glycosyltransferase involved in cell wall biosynthesis
LKVDLVLGKAWGPHLEKVPPELRVVDLKASGLLSTTIALVRYLRQEQPVAMLSALHYANEIAVWAKRFAGVSTRVIVSEHNTFSQAIQHTSKTKRHLLPFFVRHFYPWADGIVAVSQGVANDLARSTGLPIESIQAIYNPVITPELLEKTKEPLDHPWFTPGEPPVILGVGKLEAQKDFPTLIRAFAQVRQVRPARLMILGWGPDRPKLEALIQELSLEQDVSLFGYVDNPYPYMAKASVFVLSSAWEGLPTVLIEAMAVGTPVISTDCPSGAAEILGKGRYGMLTPVGDHQALAEAILKVLSNQLKVVVDQNWLEQFSLLVSTRQYLNVLGILPSILKSQS